MRTTSDVLTSAAGSKKSLVALWPICLLSGACLLFRTSDLQTEIIAVSRVEPVSRLVQPLASAQSCTRAADGFAPEITALSHDIARRFHVAQTSAVSITHAAYSAARQRGINPMLVLAVAAVESKFKPHAVNNSTGAQGLMQVMSKWHPQKVFRVGGEPSLSLIAPNIDVGTAILAEYLDAERGNVDGALGRYLGTAGGVTYVKRVEQEMAHLSKVLGAAMFDSQALNNS